MDLLLARPTTNSTTLCVLASKQFFFLVVDNDLVLAEGTLLETLQSRRLDLLLLRYVFVQREEFRRQEAAQLRFWKCHLASRLVHTDDHGIVCP